MPHARDQLVTGERLPAGEREQAEHGPPRRRPEGDRVPVAPRADLPEHLHAQRRRHMSMSR
ncbi:hypothetical protein [Luedemannella flava]|uniref:hypothetical protein n=1 Tax=Luedemannella flava TaxID=349316 RepID=UPI0031D279E7